MNELSLHLLDIAENAIRADSSTVVIRVAEDTAADTLDIRVEDNGRGMDADFLSSVESPFSTTRTTRKVGLGIPLFKQAAELTGGSLLITSVKGGGTTVRAVFGLSHIDRMPMGDLPSTFTTAILMNPVIAYELHYSVDGVTFSLLTSDIAAELGEDVPLSSPDVIEWMSGYIREGLGALGAKA